MKKSLLFFYFTFFALQFQVFAKVKNAVVFGEHSKIVQTMENGTLRIFMDMNGDFYPENVISNNELETTGNAQLAIWAKKYPAQFQKIAQSYRLEITTYSKFNYIVLQDSIRQNLLRTINKQGRIIQTWVIHGYRKKITNENADNLTSTYENSLCRKRIKPYVVNDSGHLFVEVYWDGKYLLTGGVKRVIQLGRLFKKKAIPNAQQCGYGLRRLFSGIQCQRINIITHSAGVHVVSSLLYNKMRGFSLPTPSQKDIRIAITAAASSGKKHFKRYYKRNTNLDYAASDNYTLFNLINENDFVLLKRIGRLHFTKVLGNTTLGCNRKSESQKLKSYFEKKYNNSIFLEGYVTQSRNHLFKAYIASTGFNGVLKFLYN